MSCRVLGRGVERAVLGEVLHAARARGVDHIIGIYRPTERNGMVSQHYAGLGFEQISSEDNCTRWSLTSESVTDAGPIQIVRTAEKAAVQQLSSAETA